MDETGAPVAAPEPPARKARATSGRSAAREAAKTAELDAIEREVQEKFVGLGMVLMGAAPVTGVTMMKRSTVHAGYVRNLAANNPRVLEALRKLLRASVVADVATMGLTLLLALAIDRGPVGRDAVMARAMLGDEIRDVETMEAAARHHAQNGGHPFGGKAPAGAPVGTGYVDDGVPV